MGVHIGEETSGWAIDRARLETLARFVMADQGLPNDVDVSVSLVDASVIAELNERYRHVSGPTDVLSFECDGLDHRGILGRDYAVRDGDHFILGDVIIAVEVADQQRAAFGTSLQEELEILTIHGLCHLFGYDHEKDEDALIMETREDELLAHWKCRS